MTKLLHWNDIEPLLAKVDLISSMKHAFVAHYNGKSIIPPVGELCFTDPPGDVHIKYGAFAKGRHYVVKIASGFYDNPLKGLPSSQGMMVLFDQQTGELKAILLDEGKLTDARTGASGALASKALAPKTTNQIGIVGAGIQAREQAKYLLKAQPCRRLKLWARNSAQANLAVSDLRQLGFDAHREPNIEALARQSNLLLTTTPAKSALIKANWIQPGCTIVAVGADSPHKQELETVLLAKADKVIADCPNQAVYRGEIHHGLKEGLLNVESVLSLGGVLAGIDQGRDSDDEIIVVDLTGVAVQDLAVAEAIFNASRSIQ